MRTPILLTLLVLPMSLKMGASAQIVNSWVSTPDIQWGNKSGLIADFSLQTWVVQRCGERADYRVLFAWPRGGKLNVSIRPALGLTE